jgi:hypothetical protein
MLAYLNTSKICINIDTLRTCQATIFHTVEIPIEEFNGQLTYEKIPGTEEKKWYMGPPRNDWVMSQLCRVRIGRRVQIGGRVIGNTRCME